MVSCGFTLAQGKIRDYSLEAGAREQGNVGSGGLLATRLKLEYKRSWDYPCKRTK